MQCVRNSQDAAKQKVEHDTRGESRWDYHCDGAGMVRRLRFRMSMSARRKRRLSCKVSEESPLIAAATRVCQGKRVSARGCAICASLVKLNVRYRKVEASAEVGQVPKLLETLHGFLEVLLALLQPACLV
jgi:hypothetical protein